MATERDKDQNTASVSAVVSLKSAVVIALVSALSSGAVPSCATNHRQSEILERLDRIERTIDREQRQTDRRLAALEGARGAPGQ